MFEIIKNRFRSLPIFHPVFSIDYHMVRGKCLAKIINTQYKNLFKYCILTRDNTKLT